MRFDIFGACRCLKLRSFPSCLCSLQCVLQTVLSASACVFTNPRLYLPWLHLRCHPLAPSTRSQLPRAAGCRGAVRTLCSLPSPSVRSPQMLPVLSALRALARAQPQRCELFSLYAYNLPLLNQTPPVFQPSANSRVSLTSQLPTLLPP